MSISFGLHSFRNKLVFSFTTLTILTVLVIVFSVNSRLRQASEDKIEQESRVTVNVLKQFRQTQLKNQSEATAALIRFNPQLRATLSEYNEEDLFDENLSAEEKSKALGDIVSDVSIFQQSQLFIVTDGKGTVLYQKGSLKLLGQDISDWPVIQAALEGHELFTWWGKDSPLYMELSEDQRENAVLYEVFFKPVSFGENVIGLLIIGFDTSDRPSLMKTITLSDVAFFQGNHLYSNSGSPKLRSSLEELAAKIDTRESSMIYPLEYNDEEFLVLAHHVLNGLNEVVGTIVIYRSKTIELNFFEDLSNRLNGIGFIAVVGGIIFAILISRGVVRAVNILTKGAEDVANGNLDVVLPITSQDELGDLARTFNKMTSGLKEKEHITNTFKKYVSSSVVDEVLKSDVELGGEKKEVTIYFSDLADFTSISEVLTPEELISFLNEYLSQMTRILEEHSGIVDKYIGDAIMAFWGAPIPIDHHPRRACLAALEQLSWHKNLHQQWKNHPALSSVKTRFGIHSGEVIVGNVGSERRLDYTIVGDSVNTASRLELLNKYYGTHILISESTCLALNSDMLTREIDLVQVKGKNKTTRVYELMSFVADASQEQKNLSELFNQGRKIFFERKFKEAKQIFERCLFEMKSDQASKIMITRCQELQETPPDDAWQGIHVMSEK
ncbi:MAG: HAMP domain-containing protein [SAR324 cluster bacterium]|nr:HAMP domain-containing protein [SAR324 cluster bacterium]